MEMRRIRAAERLERAKGVSETTVEELEAARQSTELHDPDNQALGGGLSVGALGLLANLSETHEGRGTLLYNNKSENSREPNDLSRFEYYVDDGTGPPPKVRSPLLVEGDYKAQLELDEAITQLLEAGLIEETLDGSFYIEYRITRKGYKKVDQREIVAPT